MAKLPFKERAISAAVVIPAAIVVVALAFLQYNWSNQVSEATSLRLADSLQMSMINWHLDFFRDFSQICVALGVDPDGEAPTDIQQLARSFSDWKAGAPYPELVSGLYIVPESSSSHGPVLGFDQASRRFVPQELPWDVENLREKLQTVRISATRGAANAGPASASGSARSQVPGQQFVESFYPGGMLTGWSFDPNLPALVHPLFASGSMTQEDKRIPVQWVVLQLNDDLIRTRILPQLAQRYFQGTEGLDFQVAVIAGSKTGKVIYSSDSDFGLREVRDADGTMDLFGRVQDKAVGSPVHVFHKPSLNKGPAAAVGVSWFPLLADEPADRDWQLIVRHRRGGPMGAFANELRRRDLMISFGVLFLLVISMAMLMITSYRAQRLAKLQMNFVTTISHELRTPLTVISSAADNIAHGVVEGKQQLTQYGSVIGSQARQLSGLVEQILLFAATREGRQRYNSRLLKVPEVIETALANTAGLIRSAQFTVEQNIESGLPPVMGDLSALSQCLQNLITNALKYSTEHRWIGVRASLEQNGMLGKEVQISVSDRGMGIASFDLPHIFEPFYRSSSVAAAQIHGTGLGLPLAKSIAEAMNGDLTVRSSPSEGSTFTLHLPVAEASVEAGEVQAAPAVAQH
ncbi:MAG TPA: HAMP domain-containing sensor histidine kinase [Candidatus Acidoferrales bacterium]|jgi:signal transduction histidine kinase|nr:HAMP domain-containing sensor histidine kinase [Candidatus Acidoferrales bacterium]